MLEKTLTGATSAILCAQESISERFHTASIGDTVANDVDKLRSFGFLLPHLLRWCHRGISRDDLQVHAEIRFL